MNVNQIWIKMNELYYYIVSLNIFCLHQTLKHSTYCKLWCNYPFNVFVSISTVRPLLGVHFHFGCNVLQKSVPPVTFSSFPSVTHISGFKRSSCCYLSHILSTPITIAWFLTFSWSVANPLLNRQWQTSPLCLGYIAATTKWRDSDWLKPWKTSLLTDW